MFRFSCVLILTLAALAVPPVAASAAPAEPCHTFVQSTSMSPAKNVVGVRVIKSSTYTIVVDNNCENLGIFVNLASTDDVVGRGLTLDPPVTSALGITTFTGTTAWDPATMNNAQYAGSWISFLDVFSDDGPSFSGQGADFRVLRAATVTAKAPALAIKDGSISVSGLLTRASWDSRLYEPFGDQPVDLQFRAVNGSYKTIKTIQSSSTGTLLSSVLGTAAGCYRYYFRGDAKTVSTPSRAACVELR